MHVLDELREVSRRSVASTTARLGKYLRRRKLTGERENALAILQELYSSISFPGLPDSREWQLLRLVDTDTDVTVAVYGVRGDPVAVGRVSPTADDGRVFSNNDVLDVLWADGRLRALHPYLPTPLAADRLRGRAVSLETAINGESARRWLKDKQLQLSDMVTMAARPVWPLYEQTATRATVDDALFDEWVARPIASLRKLGLGPAGVNSMIDQLFDVLHRTLHGHEVSLAWTHGDYWLGNLLVCDEGALAGIVDWDAAVPRGLPLRDIQHLLLTTRSLASGTDLGVAVVRTLGGDGVPGCAGLVQRAAELSGLPQLPASGLDVVLAWLMHVDAAIEKRRGRNHDRRWVKKNVEDVLCELPIARMDVQL